MFILRSISAHRCQFDLNGQSNKKGGNLLFKNNEQSSATLVFNRV